ncbi:lanthionine synthetase C family protein [Amycolatopsis sp. QT-25]|uniref:lanthionine synthetase C family protein n=1 Tax=Amycolatopsis sp. QT-25 TaxID=3034022 RepID=UPI0023EB7896|nr:lanthionine synthetase C family protein [Amycolatopsis sp. QT-25]WET81037.1 lanthionine synthetase C family protein [Amycolatopsis sp. QT-25]
MPTVPAFGTMVNDPSLNDRARECAELLVRRLADPELVAEAVARCDRAAQYPFEWGGASLFVGPAGTAVAFQNAARALPAEADYWRELAYRQLAAAARHTCDVPLAQCSMASGTAGLAFAFAQCAVDDPRYRPTLRKLSARLATQVLATPGPRGVNGVTDADYDLINGRAGILAQLCTDWRSDQLVEQAVGSLVDDLVWLCTPTSATGREPWFIPPANYPPLEEYHEDFPHGYVNLGLAHGLPGPLAALSCAVLAGVRHERLPETIQHVAEYVIEFSLAEPDGPHWPTGVGLTDDGAEDRARRPPAAWTWCYGTPGVACALLKAGAALGDDGLRTAAVDAFEGFLRRLDKHSRFPSATLCHGGAGVLAICALFARETGSVLARDKLGLLLEQVLAHCDPALPLGVQELEQPGILLDSPALLSGSAGVALALWSATAPIGSGWERALLIS